MADVEEMESGQEAETQEPEQPEAEEPQEEQPEAEGTKDQPAEEIPPFIAKRLEGLESALSETRKGKQDLQRELDYIRGRVEAAPRQPEKPKPLLTEEEFWADIPGSFAKVHHSAKQEALREARAAELDRQTKRMIKKHPDYLEAEKEYAAAVNAGQASWNEAFNAADSAEYVYEWSQSRKQGSTVSELQKRIAELEAQVSGKKPANPQPKTQAGKRTAGTSAGGNLDDPWADRAL